MGARFYDPALGRWLSADTIVPDPSNPQSFNRYSYVRGNPLKYRDPSGHMPSNFFEPGDYIAAHQVNSYAGSWDPRQQATNRARAEQGAALIVDFTPGAGDAKGFVEVFTGEDLVTGEPLGGWRYLGLVGLSELRPLRHADEAVEIIKAASRVDLEWLNILADTTQKHHWIPQQFHDDLGKLYGEIASGTLHFKEPLAVCRRSLASLRYSM